MTNVTNINLLVRCVKILSWIAVFSGMTSLVQECQAWQDTQKSGLKQARDPYYNPKLQADASPAPQGSDRRIVNPLFAAKRAIAPIVPPVEKNEAVSKDTNVVQTLPRWEPPVARTQPNSKPATTKDDLSNPLKSVPGQPDGASSGTNRLVPNSIIRNSASNQPREIVGDFSADLSKLNRAKSPAAIAGNANSASPGPNNPNPGNLGEFKPSQLGLKAGNPELKLSDNQAPDSKTAVPMNRPEDRISFLPDNQVGGRAEKAPSEFKLNSSLPATKTISQPPAEQNRSLVSPSIELTSRSPSVVSSPNPTLEPTRLLAMVGNEPVFVGDLLFELNQMIEQHLAGAPEAIKDRERQNGIGMLLNKYIDSKLLYIDTLRKLPEGADVEKIIEQAAEEFDKTAAPAMMKAAGVNSPADFDAYLRMQGTSLRKLRLHWSKDQLTRYFMSQELDVDKEVSHRELLEVYQKNLDSYAIPAKARWEQITVRFDRTASREEAERLIVEMGNKIVYGANFASVAKKGSHGFTASKGGLHDWVGKNELVSKELDHAIFSEEIGKLSDKFETAEGFHIIRVLERTEASHTSFLEAQVKIKEDLLSKKRGAAFEKHLTKLRQEIPVVRYDQNGQPEVRVAENNNR